MMIIGVGRSSEVGGGGGGGGHAPCKTRYVFTMLTVVIIFIIMP